MLRSSICKYSDAYILVSGITTITGAAAKRLYENSKGVIFKNQAPSTGCLSEINNIQIDNTKYIHVVKPMYNLIEYSGNYLKTTISSWQYYRDDPNDNITQSESFKFNIKITKNTPAAGNTQDVEIAVLLKCFSNFWRTLEMPLIHCKINLILTWSKNCVISSATGATKSKITDTKLYFPVVNLLTQDNEKLLQQLKSGFKRTINWNKYQSKVSPERKNQYLDILIDQSFQGVNRLFALLFENKED